MKDANVEEIILSEEQKFLNSFYVTKKDEKLTELYISHKAKKITYLDFSNYKDLVRLNFFDGSLSNLKLLIEGEKLTKLTLNKNQLSDLSVFSHFLDRETQKSKKIFFLFRIYQN